jgi:cytochrome c oxidase cbb3-type subunit 3
VGPNLLRSGVVLEDQSGELIAPIVHGGRVQQGMPRIDLNDTQIADVAAWLHDFNPIGKGIQFHEDIDVVTGDAKAGEAYFRKTCSSCHSATGDIAGIGSRIPVAKTLQQTWLLPGFGPGIYSAATLGLKVTPATVTVILPTGEKVTGELVRVNDFDVSLLTPQGAVQTFSRDGDIPKVQLHDPIAAHRELIPKYTDKDIHNVTAYLVTLK